MSGPSALVGGADPLSPLGGNPGSGGDGSSSRRQEIRALCPSRFPESQGGRPGRSDVDLPTPPGRQLGIGSTHIDRLFPSENGNRSAIRSGGRGVLSAPDPLGRTVRTVGEPDPVRHRPGEESHGSGAILFSSPIVALGNRGVKMISIFTRQALKDRQGSHGQALVLLLTTLTAILSVIFAAVYVAHLGGEKIASANAVDAIALSAATWEARGLNMIAALNDGIEQCFRLIRWTSVVGAAMAIAALTGLSLPAFLEYSKQAARIIRSSWNTARQFSIWAEKIKDALPYLILAETALLAQKLKGTGALYA